MIRRAQLLLLAASLLIAAPVLTMVWGCGPTTPPPPVVDAGHNQALPHVDLAAIHGGDAPIVLDPLRIVLQGRFATSALCQPCHSATPDGRQLKDSAGRSVAPFDLWRSTMMANAARDPLFRAQLSAELVATPSLADEIQTTCLTCHMPMGASDAKDAGLQPTLGLVQQHTHMSQLALDGVSCTVCHQMQPATFGTRESFNGNYVIGDKHIIFGPHEKPFVGPMQAFTTFTPTLAGHLRDSGLCATCHTLYTHPHTPDGKPAGKAIPEQTPYLEWRNSIFNNELPDPGPKAASCQGCHVPTDDVDGNAISTPIARSPGGFDYGVADRSPFGRHIFVGGNTLVPQMLGTHADELNPNAPIEAFNATIDAVRDQLRNRTASVTIGRATRDADGAPTLRVPITVFNQCGHKFPTAYPARRAWLRVIVTAPDGTRVMRIGDWDSRGRVLGAGDTVLPSEQPGGPLAPHRRTMAGPDDVVFFEMVMGDPEGRPTFTLMRASQILKDTRVLPQGWTRDHPDASETLPVGVDGDIDFVAGSDRVELQLPVPPAGQSWRVQVDVVYQPLSSRWAAELVRVDTPEVAAFWRYYEAADVRPEMVASASAEVR
ncbi:MAG: hypothetical protein AB7K09_09375 [Planctomycetota bacterium]